MNKKAVGSGTGYYLPILLSMAAVVFVIMAFTGQWPWQGNGYNSYTLQAAAWLEGRLDLGKNYEWLELAVYGGRYYVSFPPFPSYVMVPFVLLSGGAATPDHWIALVCFFTGVFYALRLCRELGESHNSAAFFVSYLCLASGLLFVSINGYVWFIAQNMCFTLLLMALYYAVRGKGGVSLTLWACAVGCRPMTALYVPLLLYILGQKLTENERKEANQEERKEQGIPLPGQCKRLLRLFAGHWYWAVGPVLLALSYMVLNYARFGSVLEFGHNYLPEFTRTETGQFDLSYLLGNIKNLFALPKAEGAGLPLQFSTANGMAFYLAAPLFITAAAALGYSILKKKKEYVVTKIFIPLATLLYILILCSHRTLGGWHFGNRYLLDTLPCLFYGLLLWKPKGEKFARWNKPLFFLGFALNLVGTVAVYNHWI